jgi:hypothetical protein
VDRLERLETQALDGADISAEVERCTRSLDALVDLLDAYDRYMYVLTDVHPVLREAAAQLME